jgi:hypothetical protein
MISDDVHVLHGALQKTVLKSSGKKDNSELYDDASTIYCDIKDRYISACQMPDSVAI